ncbi:MAG: hypothetical protein U5J83_10770 [Bryobacterales bacterium]|nr:hypothetical protein [Bryobacterales bacterium]
MAEEKTPAASTPGENAVRRLSDSQLRRESKRRRVLASAISASVSIATMVLAVGAQQLLPALYGFMAVVVMFGTNIAFVLYLFRWMAIPAKEAARRRKNSVLEMLGVTPQLEQ